MSPTAFPPESRDCESVGELLSWYANGTLGAADRTVVDSHIAFCDTCRTTLAVGRRIVESMRSPRDNVEQSPHAGWQKLAARLDSEDVTIGDAEGIESQIAAAAPMPPLTLAKAARKARRVNWPAALIVAVTVQAAAIAVLTVALLRHRQAEEAPRYHTVLKGDPTLAPTLAARGPLVRIAFDASVDDTAARRVAEQAAAEIVSGPSPDNVYTFVFPKGRGVQEGQDVAATLDARVGELRRRAHVLLVEPVVLGEPARKR